MLARSAVVIAPPPLASAAAAVATAQVLQARGELLLLERATSGSGTPTPRAFPIDSAVVLPAGASSGDAAVAGTAGALLRNEIDRLLSHWEASAAGSAASERGAVAVLLGYNGFVGLAAPHVRRAFAEALCFSLKTGNEPIDGGIIPFPASRASTDASADLVIQATASLLRGRAELVPLDMPSSLNLKLPSNLKLAAAAQVGSSASSAASAAIASGEGGVEAVEAALASVAARAAGCACIVQLTPPGQPGALPLTILDLTSAESSSPASTDALLALECVVSALLSKSAAVLDGAGQSPGPRVAVTSATSGAAQSSYVAGGRLSLATAAQAAATPPRTPPLVLGAATAHRHTKSAGGSIMPLSTATTAFGGPTPHITIVRGGTSARSAHGPSLSLSVGGRHRAPGGSLSSRDRLSSKDRASVASGSGSTHDSEELEGDFDFGFGFAVHTGPGPGAGPGQLAASASGMHGRRSSWSSAASVASSIASSGGRLNKGNSGGASDTDGASTVGGASLRKPCEHVPFRRSLLTHALQPQLHDARCPLLVCVGGRIPITGTHAAAATASAGAGRPRAGSGSGKDMAAAPASRAATRKPAAWVELLHLLRFARDCRQLRPCPSPVAAAVPTSARKPAGALSAAECQAGVAMMDSESASELDAKSAGTDARQAPAAAPDATGTHGGIITAVAATGTSRAVVMHDSDLRVVHETRHCDDRESSLSYHASESAASVVVNEQSASSAFATAVAVSAAASASAAQVQSAHSSLHSSHSSSSSFGFATAATNVNTVSTSSKSDLMTANTSLLRQTGHWHTSAAHGRMPAAVSSSHSPGGHTNHDGLGPTHSSADVPAHEDDGGAGVRLCKTATIGVSAVAGPPTPLAASIAAVLDFSPRALASGKSASQRIVSLAATDRDGAADSEPARTGRTDGKGTPYSSESAVSAASALKANQSLSATASRSEAAVVGLADSEGGDLHNTAAVASASGADMQAAFVKAVRAAGHRCPVCSALAEAVDISGGSGAAAVSVPRYFRLQPPLPQEQTDRDGSQVLEGAEAGKKTAGELIVHRRPALMASSPCRDFEAALCHAHAPASTESLDRLADALTLLRMAAQPQPQPQPRQSATSLPASAPVMRNPESPFKPASIPHFSAYVVPASLGSSCPFATSEAAAIVRLRARAKHRTEFMQATGLGSVPFSQACGAGDSKTT